MSKLLLAFYVDLVACDKPTEHLLVKVSASVVHLCWLRAVTEHEI